jgi:lipoprotein-releasing system permease protein
VKAPGFQWFVAWRYLMARPRRLSGIILGFVLVFAWVCTSVLLAIGFVPLTDEFLASGAPLPLWLPLSFGAAVALAMAVLAASAIHVGWFGRARPPPAARQLAAWLLLLAIPLVALSRGRSETSLYAGIAAAYSLWPLVILASRPAAISRWIPLLVGLAGLGAIGQLAFLSLRREGEFLANLPGLADVGTPLHSPLVIVFLAAALAAGIAALIARGREQRSGRLRLAALAVALAIVNAALWYAQQIWADGRSELIATGSDIAPPVWLTIIGGLGGAMCMLALILLVIRYFFTFFTTVSMGGVAIGTMALVITLSVMSGFETDLRSKILGSNAHVLVTRHDEAPFTRYRTIMDKVAGVSGVVAVTPYLTSEVVIAGSSNYFNVVIKGIDPRTIAKVTDLGDDLDDEDALERMWPLAEDGSVTGPPPEAGPATGSSPPRTDAPDPAPTDLQVGDAPPTDWSGGGAPPPSAPDRLDPAPADLESPDAPPTDWSGGLTEREVGPADAGRSGEPLVDAEDDIEPELDPEDEEARAGEPVGKDGGRRIDDEWLPPPARELEPHVAALPGVLVGRELSKQINLYDGQEVKIISPLGQNTIIGQTPYIKPYRVAGTFFTGMYEYDLKRVYVELGTLQDFLDLPDAVTGIEIRVSDPQDTDSITADLRRLLGPDYTVQDWKELNRSLFSALMLEKIAMFLVLAIIILVASFSIVGNLIMVVIEKAREIAVLKTLGASDSGVTRIFIVQGFFIGLVGTAIGMALGLGACLLSDHYGVGIPPDVYYIDRLPIHVEPFAVGLVAAAGLVISVAATIYPAQIASRMRPVQGLRYE